MAKRKDKGLLFTFMAPGLFVIACFFLVPIAMTIFYSFTNLSLTGKEAAAMRFIGLENYAKIMRDTTVIDAVKKTLQYTVFSVLGQNILGFLIAYLMQEKNRLFRRVAGPIFLSAWVMPEVVGSVCAYSVLADKGSINLILQIIGMAKVSWLYRHPMFSVIIANIWRGTAYSMMVYQAALDSVPGEVRDSSKIDGANKLQTITQIVVPIIKDTIMTNTMLTTLMTLGCFGMIYIMTGGGPGTKTQTLPILMYMKAFKNYELGYGTAISMILLLIAAVCGIVYVKVMGKGMEGGHEK